MVHFYYSEDCIVRGCITVSTFTQNNYIYGHLVDATKSLDYNCYRSVSPAWKVSASSLLQHFFLLQDYILIQVCSISIASLILLLISHLSFSIPLHRMSAWSLLSPQQMYKILLILKINISLKLVKVFAHVFLQLCIPISHFFSGKSHNNLSH